MQDSMALVKRINSFKMASLDSETGLFFKPVYEAKSCFA